MEEFDFNVFNLLAILVAAWAGGIAARKAGFPAILGELIIGILLGPSVLGLLHNTETIHILSEVGIILLMVYVGIEIDFHDLKIASWPGLLAAIGGFIVPFALGYYTIIWFEGDTASALFVGIAMGVTSLATKSRILVDLKLLNTRIAYVLMAGALISDTLALLVFAGILSFADAGELNLANVLKVAGRTMAFFAITIFIGLKILPKLGAKVPGSKFRTSTYYFTIILIVAFGYSEMAELAGLHGIVGAFLAGLFIKENLFPRNISREVHKSFYDVSIGFLAPIFFVSAGFSVNAHVFQTDLPMMTLIIFLAIIGKIIGTALFYFPTGHGWREGITIGAGMNGRGAVEIIIAGIGLEMGIINRDIFSILVFMAIFTTMTVPVFLKWGTNWLKRRGELVKVGRREGFLLLGVNPISLLLAKHLRKYSPVCLIDSNKDAVTLALDNGFKCIHGNALKEETMAEANAGSMDTFIGLTANSEINILAAQLAGETFLIPKNHVAISRNENGAGTNLLETVRATSLFASRVNFDFWISKIYSGQYIEAIEPVNETMETRYWVKKKNSIENILPLAIEGADGKKRPFHFKDSAEAGEKIIYIK